MLVAVLGVAGLVLAIAGAWWALEVRRRALPEAVERDMQRAASAYAAALAASGHVVGVAGARSVVAAWCLERGAQESAADLEDLLANVGESLDAEAMSIVVDAARADLVETRPRGPAFGALGRILLALACCPIVVGGIVALREPDGLAPFLGLAGAAIALYLAAWAALDAEPPATGLAERMPAVDDPEGFRDADGQGLDAETLAEALADRRTELAIREAGARVLRGRGVVLDDAAHDRAEGAAFESLGARPPLTAGAVVVRTLAIAAAALAAAAIVLHLAGV